MRNKKCKFQYCDLPSYKNHDTCILHLKNSDKDLSDFYNALDKHCNSKGYEFINIDFPERFVIYEDIDSDIRFLGCSFPQEFRIENKIIKNKISIENCKFLGPVFLTKSKFQSQFIMIDNTFEGSVYFNFSKFYDNVNFFLNNFENGANFYSIELHKIFIINNCKMGFSYFYNTDISKIEFILCKWHKSFKLAEEQYDLRIQVKFGHMGIPDTYMNHIFMKLNQYIGGNDLVVKTFFKNEYYRQKKLHQNHSTVYIIHTGWNDNSMAESTYRKLRLKYAKQGEPEISGCFFYKEKVVQRRQQKPFKRITDFLLKEFLFGYGEKPKRVILNGFIIIFLFSFIYFFAGIWNINHVKVNDFLSSLYFSIVTFTTLGYGDFHPKGYIRFFASFEALIGAVLIALFIVTLTRKYIR